MNYLIYHSKDLDGQCSGALAKEYFLKMERPFTMVPFNYGEQLYYAPTKEDTVYFMDVTDLPTIKKWVDQGIHVVVLDHHKTFLESDLFHSVDGNSKVCLINPHHAGCLLSQAWFFPVERVECIVREEVVLLSLYDTWTKHLLDWETQVLPFQMGMRTLNWEPSTDEGYANWVSYFQQPQLLSKKDAIQMFIDKGNTILTYQKEWNRKTVESCATDVFLKTSVGGYKALVCNSNEKNSLLFQSQWDEKKYDIMLVYYINKNKEVDISFYTTKKEVDCSKVAKSFGGGGHAAASGCKMSLGFFLKEILN